MFSNSVVLLAEQRPSKPANHHFWAEQTKTIFKKKSCYPRYRILYITQKNKPSIR